MAAQNGTIDGVSLLSGTPEGFTNKVSSTTYTRKAYLITATFPLYTTGDTATVTGIITAISAATRNGRTLTLRYCAPLYCGVDSAGTTSFFTNTANALITLSNTTTTGDAAGILADSAGTAITTDAGAMAGVGFVAVVDES